MKVGITKYIIAFLFTCWFSIILAGQLEVQANSNQALVLEDNLFMYQESNTESSIIKMLNKDEKVIIQAEDSGWYNIITSFEEEGWVYGGLLMENLTVQNESVNVYPKPSTRTLPLDQLSKGAQITVNAEVNGWYQIVSNDVEGWVYYSHLTPQDTPTLVKQGVDKPAIVLKENLDVYSGASTRTTIIGQLSKDFPVQIKYEINGWYQITSDAINGWVYSNLLPAHQTVNGEKVNVYETPTTRGNNVIANLNKGNQVTISREINGWYQITSNSITGWVYYTHLQYGSPQVINFLNKQGIVLTNGLKVYIGASTRTSQIGSLPKDMTVSMMKEINGWYEIKSELINGWVYKNLLNKESVVNGPEVNVYEVPSVRGNRVTANLEKGDPLTILKEINGWYQIKANTIEGWVYYTHVQNGSPYVIRYLNRTPAIVTLNGLKVYSGASTRTNQIATLAKDAPVTMLKENNGWYEISSGNINGWVYGNLLPSNKSVESTNVNIYDLPSTRQNVIAALSQGETVQITNEINGWYKIISGDRSGWIYGQHLKDGSPILFEVVNKPGLVIVENANIYDKPSTRSTSSQTSVKGESVTIKQKIKDWYEISSSSVSGWIYDGVVTTEQTTNVDNIDVYESPSTRVNFSGHLSKSTPITIKEELNGWYLISSNNVNGWIYSTHLKNGSPVRPRIPAAVTENKLNVYADPERNQTIVGEFSKGNIVTITRQVDNSYYIETTNLTGWVDINSVSIISNNSVTSLAGKTIVLDAGHGGHDSGAIGKTYRTYEKNLNLSTVILLKSKLEKYGVNVILTRSDDRYLYLPDRVKVSNENELTDAFISVHYNSSTSNSVSGIESLYYTYSKDYVLASTLQTSMLKHTGLVNRGVRFQDLHVTRENIRPSTLVELGFLSNAKEEYLVRTSQYQDKITNGIVEGLINFFR